MYLLPVVRYACEADFSNASGSVLPERMDTEWTDIDAFKSDTSLMASAANPGTCADVASRGYISLLKRDQGVWRRTSRPGLHGHSPGVGRPQVCWYFPF